MKYLLVIIVFIIIFPFPVFAVSGNASWWTVQSIDTMKYSRDLAREKLHDDKFLMEIDLQVKEISQTGATHIAVGTPYDEEFYPFLIKWVNAARKYGLNVWFRGNFSGWEGWFNYPKITPKEHKEKTLDFIKKHEDLFRDGDIFTACPECENGVLGDPRGNGGVGIFRDFLIDEYTDVKNEFLKIPKKVSANYYSMNADIARLVMDKKTTSRLDGIVVIDHYIKDPLKLQEDIDKISSQSGGKVVLGEFGAPIPDIHGNLDENSQAVWINQALKKLVYNKNFGGLNYWVNIGGTTALWNYDHSPKAAVSILSSFYLPKTLNGKIVSPSGIPVTDATISAKEKVVSSNSGGQFELPYFDNLDGLTISKPGYYSLTTTVNNKHGENKFTLKPLKESMVQKIFSFFRQIFKY